MTELTEDQYRNLKRRVEAAKTEADQARGALDQLMHQLEEEHGCKSVKEAAQLLEKLEREAENALSKFEEAMKKYRQKWGGDDD